MPSNITTNRALSHTHSPACRCGERHDHRTVAGGAARALSALAPVIACAFCPACLASYTKLLSLVGIGLALTEKQHTILLSVALGISISASIWRACRVGRWSPFAGALCGALLAIAGHWSERAWVEWSGAGILIASAWYEERVARRQRGSSRPSGQSGSIDPLPPGRAPEFVSGADR